MDEPRRSMVRPRLQFVEKERFHKQASKVGDMSVTVKPVKRVHVVVIYSPIVLTRHVSYLQEASLQRCEWQSQTLRGLSRIVLSRQVSSLQRYGVTEPETSET
jgi:hypothetical protein